MSTQPTLADMLQRIQRLPALPAVALDLLNTLAGSEPDVISLARRIAQDQAIAARVLRVANSPFYGLQKRVGSVHDAVVVLGFYAVRSLVLAAAVVTGLPGGQCTGFEPDRFWRHVMGTAVAAQALARRLGRDAEAIFVAGLLHDIGRLAMVAIYPELFSRAVAVARERDCSLQEVELEIFGFDHAAVGAALARRWNFPEETIDALACHHQPAHGAPGGLAALIHYADAISKSLDFEEAEDTLMPILDAESVDALGLDWQALIEVLAETQARFDSYRLMLG